jgi:hypothetical protein
MLHDPPMLADFGVRLAFGLATLLLMTPWRAVPLGFFRTHCVVILGLLVLSALDGSRAAGVDLYLPVAAAVSAYLAAVSWGLGLIRAAIPLTALVALVAGGWLALVSQADPPALWAFNAVSRYASGLLMGATLTAMLLGHHYLTAPAMSIEPLNRFVVFMGGALAARACLALAGLLLAMGHNWSPQPYAVDPGSLLLIVTRWGMGFGGSLVATVLARKTVRIRSTQSATGILYVALALVLFGELTSLVLARTGGWIR